MSQPTPRQVLYGLVAAGFWSVVLVLTAVAATSGVSPGWWTAVLSGLLAVSGIWMALNWRKTGPMLVISNGLFIIWLVGTLVTR
jgi:hypothetical protein